MKKNSDIRYIQQANIDKAKWNACIDQSYNGLIYAYSWYLDNISKHWDALVLNDYEAVMPLTWNKKWGFHYLYQPFFTSALGVFSKEVIDTNLFLGAIPPHFKYWDIDLNESNIVEAHVHHNTSCRSRVNYMLNLHTPYQEIKESYKRLAKRMLKKASDAQIKIVRGISPTEVINLYKTEYKHKHSGIPDAIYDQLTVCTEIAYNNEMAQAYLAKSANDQILAFYLVLLDSNYIYSLLGGSTPEGQEHGAFYMLTDAAIQDHADTNRMFRFEGSDLEGIAFFNSQFGPELTNYTHIIRNQLPWPIKLLK